MTNILSDNLMLLKESIKSKLAHNPLSLRRHPAHALAEKIAKRVGVERIERIIDDKSNSYVIVTDGMVIRLPLNKLSAARCRLNKIMLEKLKDTGIAHLVPIFIRAGNLNGHKYYCESRIPGLAIDLPLSRMDALVGKCARFITEFHRKTARDIRIDDVNYHRLFGREFKRLSGFLNYEYRQKLNEIEASLKKQVLGKDLKTVWLHGDFKVENVLFDVKTWQIKGVIDWDLSRREGLPLLDIFYLLIYKADLMTKEGAAEIFKTRFIKLRFLTEEKEIIYNHLKTLNLEPQFIKPMLIIFWLHHLTGRYQQRLLDKKAGLNSWFTQNIIEVIDAILGSERKNANV